MFAISYGSYAEIEDHMIPPFVDIIAPVSWTPRLFRSLVAYSTDSHLIFIFVDYFDAIFELFFSLHRIILDLHAHYL